MATSEVVKVTEYISMHAHVGHHIVTLNQCGHDTMFTSLPTLISVVSHAKVGLYNLTALNTIACSQLQGLVASQLCCCQKGKFQALKL